MAAPLVARPRLIRRLRDASTPVVLLNAPSGYGKSVLVSQWSEGESRRVESVPLTEDHNLAATLARAIVAALERIEPLPTDISATLAGRAPDTEKRLLPLLASALAAWERPFVLALDGLDRVESPDSLRLVSAIGELLPRRSQLALVTRTDPPIPVGRLRAHRGLTELGRGDLAMNKSECGELLASLGVEPTPHQLDVLVLRTEGWPAALFLAGLALSEAGDLGEAIDDFAGDDRIVVDYIREELLGGLSRRRLEFLQRASILERACGSVCDEILGRTGSSTVLRELSRSNMLLTPLDRRDEWFRLHPLLRDALRSELRRTEPELEPELHRRASDWWAEHGEPEQALDHAVEVRALARAGELLWDLYPEYSSRGRHASVKCWLDRIGSDGVASDPYLSLTAGFEAIGQGAAAEADHWGAVSHGLSVGMDESPERDELSAALALIRAALARNGLAAMVEDAVAAAESFGPASPWVSTCWLLEGTGLHLQGLREPARIRLADGARRGAVVAPTSQVLCLAQLALLAIEEDDWRAAETLAWQAMAQLDRSGIGSHPPMALGLAVSALVSSHAGQPERAMADLRQSLTLLNRLDGFASWYVAESCVVLARAAVRFNDAPTASRLLDDAVRAVRPIPDAVVLHEWIEQTRAMIATVSASGIRNLTPAELRVLQYMPTRLSLSEIAEAIFVSQNTVKTQVQGLYRKLSVSSRRGAVDEAVRLGLVDEARPQ